jgi:hypothetical protein
LLLAFGSAFRVWSHLPFGLCSPCSSANVTAGLTPGNE